MFVANHLSMIDIMLVLMAVKNPFVFVGKRELEEIPLFNYIYRRASNKLSHVACAILDKVFASNWDCNENCERDRYASK